VISSSVNRSPGNPPLCSRQIPTAVCASLIRPKVSPSVRCRQVVPCWSWPALSPAEAMFLDPLTTAMTLDSFPCPPDSLVFSPPKAAAQCRTSSSFPEWRSILKICPLAFPLLRIASHFLRHTSHSPRSGAGMHTCRYIKTQPGQLVLEAWYAEPPPPFVHQSTRGSFPTSPPPLKPPASSFPGLPSYVPFLP